MDKERKVFIACIVTLFLVISVIVPPYNSMVEARNNVKGQKAQIENVLQARIEKIPDLVATVKSYAEHEEAVFTKVAEARAGLQSAIESGDVQKMANANEELSTALNGLNVVVEAYPELQSSKLYISLMDEISGSVNRISQERRAYNILVTEYNNMVEKFPYKVYAEIFGFASEKYFEADEKASTTNVVDFSN